MSMPALAPAHAILAASAAHRWLKCTPSARLEESLLPSSSDYADEGRLAHEIACLKLLKTFVEPMAQRIFSTRLKKLQAERLYQDEMLHHTNTYLDYVSQIAYSYKSKPYVAVEARVSFGEYVPEGFGTSDCVIIGGDTMHVIDFKYGKGVPVDAHMNPQIMLYALGALSTYSILYDIATVKMAIVQPRLDTVSEFSMPVEDIHKWGTDIIPVALKAWKGEGEFLPGEHCRFCRAKATCRARSDSYSALQDFGLMKPPLISNEEIGAILQKAVDLAAWVEDLKEYALSECLSGKQIPGWKAVPGRSVRQWTDIDAAFTAVKKDGIDDAMLYERKPITLAATEKLLGKSRFQELLGCYVTTPPGKPTLVEIGDRREAITRASAQDDFGKGETENA